MVGKVMQVGVASSCLVGEVMCKGRIFSAVTGTERSTWVGNIIHSAVPFPIVWL